jgi:predicted Zn-dependent peptidase
MTQIIPGAGPRTVRSLSPVGLVLLGSMVPGTVWSQTSDSPTSRSGGQAPSSDSLITAAPETKANPFAGFETHFLSNGLKVWFKHLPDAPSVSISVGVPYGWDQDPHGKEELAHYTEHMLFSDHDGQTEQEIKDAIEGIGGRRNAFTTPDHTWYYVTVLKEHGGFGIEWMSRLMSPHTMDPEVVEQNRQPVALEIRAQPREFFEQAWALLNPSWLVPNDFWRREFGMETRNGRRYDRWASLQRITPEDVSNFYDRYYVPGAMTLTVIGDLPRSEVLEISERTFGSLSRRPVPAFDVVIEDPARRRAISYWGFGPNVRYRARHKYFSSGAEDDLMMLFVRDLLRRRLNQRLRYGEQKAVYGIQVTTTQRGPGGYLQIQGSIDEEDYEFAEAVIEEELTALRDGTLPPEEFETDRTALVERLRGDNLTAEDLNLWVFRNFYDPVTHRDFPDLLSFFERVTQAEVASFATSSFTPEREVTTVFRVQPVSQGLLALAALLLVFLTVRLVAWTLTRPVSMREIQYVARFRVPILLRIGRTVVFGGIGLILARLIVFVVQALSLAYFVTVDDYSIRMVGYALMLATAIVLFIVYLSRFPRKILVFPDHLRIKSLAYRSRILRPGDVEEISTRRIHQVWLTKMLFRCVPLTLGLAGPGIYVRPTNGKAYFFRTRNNRELIEVLGEWWGESVSPAKDKTPEPSRDSAPTPDPAPAEKPPTRVAQDPLPEERRDPPEEDIDYDSIGLTDAELEELLGEPPESDA